MPVLTAGAPSAAGGFPRMHSYEALSLPGDGAGTWPEKQATAVTEAVLGP